MPARKVQVSATVNGKTAVIPRDAQRLTTQTPSKARSAQKKKHDVCTGGQWTRPVSCGLIYAEVEAGDAVEITREACKQPCKNVSFKAHKCRIETETSVETVAYVINSGVSTSGPHMGEPFTRFIPLYDAEGAKERKVAKLKAQLAALGE